MAKIHTIVVGTAGHIDHGKSTLVERLTGVNPDRLPEEKERGMTIDLGFAPLALADGTRVGIVDVPGHERFVKNMVAGATGIDFVLLVVACDDGVMPQTREHLEILDLLGVRRGLVALTKADLVEPGMVDLVAEDVRETLSGTTLAGAPVLPVSSATGAGIEELRSTLERLARETPPRSAEGVFRMPIQRVFSARGHGTVVTGIPVSGLVKVGDRVEILPPSLVGKVRGVQAYKEAVEEGRAGHSTALNLADLDYRAVSRGMVAAAPGFFHPATMVEARLRYLSRNRRPLEDRTEVRFHAGTSETIGVVVLLDCKELAPGGEAFVQFRLMEPVVAAPGDAFIVRLASPMVTLGGGTVLGESARRLKRFKGFVLEDLEKKAEALHDPRARVVYALERAGVRGARADALAREAVVPPPDAASALDGLEREGSARRLRAGLWMHREGWEEALARVRSAIEAALARAPHRAVVGRLAVREASRLEGDVLDAVLESLSRDGEVAEERGAMLRPLRWKPRLSTAAAACLEAALGAIRDGGFNPPTLPEIASAVGAKPADLREALENLADEGKVVFVSPELAFEAAVVERVKALVAENVRARGALDIPALRDALGTTRKYLIPLLEHLDEIGFTVRQGAHRILRARS